MVDSSYDLPYHDHFLHLKKTLKGVHDEDLLRIARSMISQAILWNMPQTTRIILDFLEVPQCNCLKERIAFYQLLGDIL